MILSNEVRGKIIAKGLTLKEAAEGLGITYAALNKKLKIGVLKSNEIESLMEMLGIDDPRPIFFAKKVT